MIGVNFKNRLHGNKFSYFCVLTILFTLYSLKKGCMSSGKNFFFFVEIIVDFSLSTSTVVSHVLQQSLNII